MDNQPANSNEHAQKFKEGIDKAWPGNTLTKEELDSYKTNPDKFYAAVQTKCKINKADAEKIVTKLHDECVAACAKNKASAPTAKAS